MKYYQGGNQGRRQVKNSGVDTHGEREEHEPTTGVWGQCRQRSRGAEPQFRGVREAENLLAFGAQWKPQICFILRILQTP